MRDSSFWERLESDRQRERKNKEKKNDRKMETGLALPAGLFEAVTVSPWKKDGI